MIKKRDIKDTIDRYLDIHNDYMTLYKMFGDKHYKETAECMIIRIKQYQQGYF